MTSRSPRHTFVIASTSTEEGSIDVIVVEGPDGSGKSTLVDMLLDEFPKLQRAPRASESATGPVADLARWVDEDLTRDVAGLVYDRHPLVSEPIYGSVVRHNLRPGFDSPHQLQARWVRWLRRDPLLVVCLPDVETVQANVAQSDVQMPNVRETTAMVHGLYVNALATFPGRKERWDYTTLWSRAQFKHICDIVHRSEPVE